MINSSVMLRIPTFLRPQWAVCLIVTVCLMSGCGVGSSGEGASADAGDGGVSSDPITDTAQLTLALSGQTKYRADEGVSLSYSVGGSAAASATITYEGPVELALDTTAATVTGDALLPGIYDVKLTATSGNVIAEDQVKLYIDANFGGRYAGGGESEFALTMGRSIPEIDDATGFVLSRTGTLFWHSQETDATAFVNLLCVADVVVSGDEASGTGQCKTLVDDEIQVYTVPDLVVTYKETGELSLAYTYEETGAGFDVDFAVAGEAYVSPDLDLSGVYQSSLLADLDYLIVVDDALSAESSGSSVRRCGITATLTPYDTELITATEGDGSIIPAEEITIDNCDLSDQDGYAVSVGNAEGSGQSGLLLILQGGISDSVIRFDLYTRRAAEQPDPLSKLRYVRVCYQGLPTSQAEIYGVTAEECESYAP